MSFVNVSSGQTYSGFVASADLVTVARGGIASGVHVDGLLFIEGGSAQGVTVDGFGSLRVLSGGSATGTIVESNGIFNNESFATDTVVNGGVLFGSGTNLYTTLNNAKFSASGLLTGTVVNAGGELQVGTRSATGTIVNAYGTDRVEGTDTGTTVMSGGALIADSGVAVSSVVNAGALVYAVLPYTTNLGFDSNAGQASFGGGSFLNPRVSAYGGITAPTTAINGAALQPGSYLALTLAYAPGGTATLDAASDVLTIRQGGSVTNLQLSGSYAGDSFSLVSALPNHQTDEGFAATQQTLLIVTAGSTSAFSSLASFNGSLTGAATLAVTAYAGVTNLFDTQSAGVLSRALDAQGDQVIFSTSNGAPHTINAFGTGQSVIAAGGGNDTVVVANGADQIATGAGTNTVYLTTGSNTLQSEGNDQVIVGAGADTINVAGTALVTAGSATLALALAPMATLGLHTGTGSVTVQGGFGGGTFSGGTNGHNLLIAGTAATTLYAGGDGDLLLASGGDRTTLNGWGGQETMNGQFSQGLDTFNFNGANVTATGGAGQNVFNLGYGNSLVSCGTGTAQFNATNGSGGGNTYIGYFSTSNDHVHLTGFAADEASYALSTATISGGSETLRLRDSTTLTFGNITGLTTSSFT